MEEFIRNTFTINDNSSGQRECKRKNAKNI